MQSYAACADAVIQARVRENYGELVKEVTRLSGATPEEVWQFFSHGMLLNVIASLDLRAISEQDEWARAWCEPGELIRAAARVRRWEVSPSDPRELGSPGDVTPSRLALPFDADTALEPRASGRWRAWAPEHWFVGRGPNGGFLAAIAARAAEAAAGRPLRSLVAALRRLAGRRAARRRGRRWSARAARTPPQRCGSSRTGGR